MFQFLPFGKKTKTLKIIRRRREDIEPHEIFYDSLAQKQQASSAVGDKKIIPSLSKRSIVLPFWFAAAMFVVFIARIAQMNLLDGASYKIQAQQNKYIFQKVQAERGIIYDQNLKPLVQNLSSFDLNCDKNKMLADENVLAKTVQSLATVLNLDENDLKKKIDSGQNPVVHNISHHELIILEARAADFKGCQTVSRPIRNYLSGYGLAPVLGYMNKITEKEWLTAQDDYSIDDYVGRSGLEQFYENTLRKNPGSMRIERDAKGRIISKNEAESPQSGDSLVLWLDLELQKKLNDVLSQQLKNLGLTNAAAVALDPNTGGVLALVSLPDYDNNVFSEGSSEQIQKIIGDDQTQPLFNRVIKGQYLTGSIIKPFEAAGALQEKIINPDKQINCQGYIEVKNQYDPSIIYRYNDNHIHGLTDMRKAIAESCNDYFYIIGGGYNNQTGLGPTRIKKYLSLFGWDSPTGIDLPGEVAGFIPDPLWKKEKFAGTPDQVWTDGDTYNLAIGQGFIRITPIEVAAAYAAIANNGTLYEPHLVQKIVDSAGNIIEEKKPLIKRQNFIDPENLQVVREGMRHCVNGAGAPLASALALNSLGIPMAAKTGTAQLRKGPDGKDLLNSWVTVWAPYDHPQILLTIMMENVHEGTVAVLPVAKDVLGWYFNGRANGADKDQNNQNNESNENNEDGNNNENNNENNNTQTQPVADEESQKPQQIEQQIQQIQTQINQLQNFLPAPANTNTAISKPETGE